MLTTVAAISALYQVIAVHYPHMEVVIVEDAGGYDWRLFQGTLYFDGSLPSLADAMWDAARWLLSRFDSSEDNIVPLALYRQVKRPKSHRSPARRERESPPSEVS